VNEIALLTREKRPLGFLAGETELTYGQFHQHFMCAFAPVFLRQSNSNLKCTHKKALRETFVQKGACKMLVELTPVFK
jgi:hypothetical protein